MLNMVTLSLLGILTVVAEILESFLSLINSDTEQHTRITSWFKFKSLELSVFALEIRESLRANMEAHQADVHLRFPRLQLFTDLHFPWIEN